jgi:hypothetical protein
VAVLSIGTATMYLLQGLIVFAVVGSNIHWQWTPNPYLAAGLAFSRSAASLVWALARFRGCCALSR